MVATKLDTKATQILAKSLFKELRGNGYTDQQILSLTTELIGLLTQDIKSGADAPHPAVIEQDERGWRAAL